MKNQLMILLAEDDGNDVFLLRHTFKGAGLAHAIVDVPDGQVAVDYLSAEPPYSDRLQYPLPNLVLLDLKMPRMSGFDVLSWLRSQPAFSKLPVVVWSNSVLEEDKQRVLNLGANAYFSKPSRSEEWSKFAYELDAKWIQNSERPWKEI